MSAEAGLDVRVYQHHDVLQNVQPSAQIDDYAQRSVSPVLGGGDLPLTTFGLTVTLAWIWWTRSGTVPFQRLV